MWYVYILQTDTKHYIGVTEDISRRLKEHHHGGTRTTASMKNIKLLGYFIKQTKEEAYVLEKMIKKNGHISHWINHATFVHYNI